MPAEACDVADGPAGDFLRPNVVRHLRDRIRSGCFCLMWSGVPCNTFSRATDRPNDPRPLRSNTHFHGLPELDAKQNARVQTASRPVRIVCSLARDCIKRGIPGVIENPRAPRLWLLSEIRHLEKSASSVVLDY
eukprot:8210483-Pyramimonas_sp.AAC.1